MVEQSHRVQEETVEKQQLHTQLEVQRIQLLTLTSELSFNEFKSTTQEVILKKSLLFWVKDKTMVMNNNDWMDHKDYSGILIN